MKNLAIRDWRGSREDAVVDWVAEEINQIELVRWSLNSWLYYSVQSVAIEVTSMIFIFIDLFLRGASSCQDE